MLWPYIHGESKYDLKATVTHHLSRFRFIWPTTDFTSVQELYKDIHDSSSVQSISCKLLLIVLPPTLLLQFGLSAFNAKVIKKTIPFFQKEFH